MNKYTPDSLVEFRKNPLVQKWRASNINSTIIINPTVEEIRNTASYANVVNDYVKHLTSSIFEQERLLWREVTVRSAEYYKNRYDLTPVENSILRAKIIEVKA